MAEGFEPFHVPQQSRRDKLRVHHNNNNFVSIYHDPSINLEYFPTSCIDPVQENNITSNPFLYTPQNLRFLENNNINNSFITNGHHHHQGLSLSLSSNTTNDLSKNISCVPFGPFTGYSVILKKSRFLKPAEMLLEELFDMGIYYEKFSDDDDYYSLMDPSVEINEFVNVHRQACYNGDEHLRKKSRLISMLHEVYQKYKQYYQQLQMVVTSFESVAGLGNAAPFANLALKSMSKHFKILKNSINDQLQFTIKSHSQMNCENSDPIPRIPNHSAGFGDKTQPVWRPQRGLPERAVTVLRAWLFDHFLHPYPTDTDKVMLARQTGLSRNQVSNWFINARVRLWKPMVEEIHNLETKEAHKSSQRNEGQNINNNPIDQTPSTSIAPKIQDIQISYDNMSSATGGVSLTLGLHRNTSTRVGLSEPFPIINAARRFGIDANSDQRFMINGGFEEQQHGQF